MIYSMTYTTPYDIRRYFPGVTYAVDHVVGCSFSNLAIPSQIIEARARVHTRNKTHYEKI